MLFNHTYAELNTFLQKKSIAVWLTTYQLLRSHPVDASLPRTAALNWPGSATAVPSGQDSQHMQTIQLLIYTPSHLTAPPSLFVTARL